MGPLLALAVAGTAMDVAGKIGEASAGRRLADKKATALRSAAQRRLAQGEQMSGAKLVEGGMNQTSQLASFLSSGGSRQALISDLSLDEIAKRAKFEADQAISDAKYEADMLMSDANDIVKDSRNAQRTATISAGGSLLSLGSQYYQGRYGNNAAKTAGLWSI
jgi:hypothetical protein